VQVVTRLKRLSARALFAEFPQVKRQLWGGEFWEDSYFARTVGEEVTAEIIRRYIAGHRSPPERRPADPRLFSDEDADTFEAPESPAACGGVLY
jgi:hypothetical protein